MIAELSRQVTLPWEIVEKLGLHDGDKLEVVERGGTITIMPVSARIKEYNDKADDEYLLALAEERLKNDSGVKYAAEDVYTRLGIEDDNEIEVEIG